MTIVETGIIISMKISNDAFENRTRHLPSCSAVPQLNASLRTPFHIPTTLKWLSYIRFLNLFVCLFVVGVFSDNYTAVIFRVNEFVPSVYTKFSQAEC